MTSSNIRTTFRIFSLFWLLSLANARLVAFRYVEDSATCNQGDEWNLVLDYFHIDCGNANHGCTPGHSILIYGEFEAMDMFYSVADIDIGACVFGHMVCTPNILETDMNVCADLELWDIDGYQACNEPGIYSFEASYMLPNHTWYEDFAFEGFTFNIYITFDSDLTCHAQFVTHVYYGNEAWMAFAVASMAFGLGVYCYVKRRQQERGKIDLAVEEAKAEQQAGAELLETPSNSNNLSKKKDKTKKSKKKSNSRTKNAGRSSPSGGDITDDESVTSTAYLRMLPTTFPLGGDITDDESVTSTAYSRMLDSPKSHAEQMEMVRQAHFDRLRQTRESRHAPSKVLLSSLSRESS